MSLPGTTRATTHRTCRARKVLDDALPEGAAREKVWASIDGDSVPGLALARYLQDRGIPVSADAVRRHRKGDCSCPRT